MPLTSAHACNQMSLWAWTVILIGKDFPGSEISINMFWCSSREPTKQCQMYVQNSKAVTKKVHNLES